MLQSQGLQPELDPAYTVREARVIPVAGNAGTERY